MRTSYVKGLRERLHVSAAKHGRIADHTVRASYLDAAQWIDMPGMSCVRSGSSVLWRRPGLSIKVMPESKSIYVDRGTGIKIKSEIVKYEGINGLQQTLLQLAQPQH
ncbi:hypothetical protein [Achromobacter phage Motura]|uniref:Uncharacterized protein n=1 Tax=Achromobacter phage Motura TaxID=2591403 RepID=A0A514CSX1_9CAUD|nr:hypothetical protein H1O15_gp201 [Achromobacter phage Motura]QDH83587.1 hypothetical protein [Achromobacter phage Motura]